MADVGNHADNDEITELDVDESNAGSVATAEAAKKKKKKKKNPATNSSDARLFGFTFSPTRFQMVRVRFLEGKGRCLETSRKLPAGTPFFREKAICSIAHDKQLCALCSCFISDATASCGDDMLPFDSFCSQRCLQQSLDLFQLEFAAQSQLQLIAQSYSCSLDLVRMVCRIICTRANQVLKQVPRSRLEAPDADIVDDVAHLSLDTAKSDAIAISAATASFLSDNGDFITATFCGLKTLEDHMSDQAPSWRDAITSAMSELLKHLPESVRSLFTVEDAVSIAGRINVNAYGIVVDVPVPPAATLHQRVSEASTAAATTRRVAAGFGLFPAVGLCVNHACRPNSVFSFGTTVDVDGSPLSVMDYRTITEVAAAAELTVSYIDIFQGTPDRQKLLRESRFFDCRCDRCESFKRLQEYVRKGEVLPQAASAAAQTPAGIEDEDWADCVAAAGSSAGSGGGGGAKGGKTAKRGNSNNSKSNNNSSSTGSAGQGDVKKAAKSAAASAPIVPEFVLPVGAVVADAMMSALLCPNCGENGAVIVATEPDAAGCFACGHKVDFAEATSALDTARTAWKLCSSTVDAYSRSAAAATTGSSAASYLSEGVALVEKWMSDWDPDFTTCAASLIPGSSNGATNSSRRRKPKFPLHPRHACVYDACVTLANLSKSPSLSGCDYPRALICLRRAYMIMQSVAPPNYPDVASMAVEIADTLLAIAESKPTVAGAKNKSQSQSQQSAQGLKRERKEFLTTALNIRKVCFGDSHPLTAALASSLASRE